MRAVLGLMGFVVAAAVGFYIFNVQHQGAAGEALPERQIDIAAVRADLLSLAQAERLHMASNAAYVPLEDLDGEIRTRLAGRNGYRYRIEIEGTRRFRIIAEPSPLSGHGLPSLSIDETMRITAR